MNSMVRTQKELNTLLTEKGKGAVDSGWNLAKCIQITKDKVGDVAFNSSYAEKLHHRKLGDYLQTLYQMNGQVNTQLMKIVHNIVAVENLIDSGYLNEARFEELLPKLDSKMCETSMQNFKKKLPEFKSFMEMEDWLVVHYRGVVSIIHKSNFKNVVPDVKSGEWECGGDREQIKKFREANKHKAAPFYLKNSDDGIIVVSRSSGETFILYKGTSKGFDFGKFIKQNRTYSWQEMKDLIESKRIDQDKKWFEQFLKQ